MPRALLSREMETAWVRAAWDLRSIRCQRYTAKPTIAGSLPQPEFEP
jgi:hypothetical protein